MLGVGGQWNCWGNPDYTDPAGGIRSGVECDPETNGICQDSPPDSTWAVYRSYLNFAVPPSLAGASFVGARLVLNEVQSWSCNASTVELWQTTAATSDDTWSNRPAEQTWQDSLNAAHGWPPGSGSSCAAAPITLDASSALGQAAAQGWGQVTLEVRASLSDENASPPVVNSWKRFQATASTDCTGGAPCLKVFWAHTPEQAQAAGTEGTFDAQTGQTGTDCATSQASPDYVSVTNPVWDASAGDEDGNPIYGQFPWTNITTGATGTWLANMPVAAGSQFQGQRTGSPGDEYKWQAYGEVRPINQLTNNTVTLDGANSSPPCYFAIDTTPPAGTVDVSSDIYQDNVPSGGIGTAGTFTFTDSNPADSDVVGYLYGTDPNAQPTEYVQATNGTASIQLTPYTSGDEDLYVRAVDRAGNPGPLKMSGGTTVPSFVIIPSTSLPNIKTLGYWKLNSATAGDASGKGSELTSTPGAGYPCAQQNPPGYQCSLTGEADTYRPVVSDKAGYTISAWVSLPYCQSYCTAMSEDANKVPAFSLAWRPSGQSGCPTDLGGCWEFSMHYSDDSTTTLDTAQAPITQIPPNWVQLTGVFDPTQTVGSQRGTLTLYVNGVQAAQFAGAPIWSTDPPVSGVLRLGAGFGGAYPWVGSVSDACVFYGALQPSDVQLLYSGNSVTTDGCKAVFNEYH